MEPEPRVLDALIDSPLSLGLGPADVRTLARSFVLQQFPAGSALYIEDEAGDCLDYIVSGQVEVKKQKTEGQDIHLANLGAGRLIGELEILDASPRAASVVALDTTTVLRLGRAEFQHLTEVAPHLSNGLLQAMVRILADHLRQMDALRAAEQES